MPSWTALGPRQGLLVKIQLLIVPSCPHTAAAGALLRQSLDGLGLNELGFSVVVVDDPDQARRLGFRGSPSFHVDGVDVLGHGEASGGLACRLYRTPDGLTSGTPDVETLRAALARAGRHSRASARADREHE
jgi:hypothetical protein